MDNARDCSGLRLDLSRDSRTACAQPVTPPQAPPSQDAETSREPLDEHRQRPRDEGDAPLIPASLSWGAAIRGGRRW